MDLALDRLIPAHAASVQRVTDILSAKLSLAAWRSGVAGGVMAWQFAKHATTYSNVAVWLRGAASVIREHDGEADASGTMQANLRAMAGNARVTRENTIAILPSIERANIGGTRPALQRALRSVAKESMSLEREALACLAELIRHDADFAVREPGWQASTPEEVRELFARL